MKATMLKIAGVKDEKSFYKKFPDEASFIKAHGKEFKKALLGEKIKKAANGIDYTFGQYTERQMPGQLGYNLSGDQSKQMYNLQGNPIAGKTIQQTISGPASTAVSQTASKFAPYMQPLSDVFAGISMIGSQKQKVREARQKSLVTDVQADAAESRDIDANRMNEQLMWRPEDMLSPSYRAYGEGTNPLSKHGKTIPKAQFGLDVFSNKLNNGKVANFMNQGGAGLVDNLGNVFTNNKYGPSAGSQIGKGIGAGVGTAFLGPVGGIVGGFVGKIAGDLFDKDAERIERFENIANKNRQRAQGQLFAQGIQQQNQSFMEDGGTIDNQKLKEYNELKDFLSIAREAVGKNDKKTLERIGLSKPYTHNDLAADLHRAQQLRQELEFSPIKNIKEDVSLVLPHMGQSLRGVVNQAVGTNFEYGGNLTNPQVITKFGEHTMRELLAPDRTMDTLRTGGHLRQNMMDGDLQMYDGGAKPISYNPFLPEGGETVEFRGPSHEEGGMNVAYGKNPVEVEGGEPAVKMQNGGGASDLVVFGNLNIPKGTLNDPKAKGKFKSYIKDISRQEEHKNKVVDKSVKGLEDLDVITPFDKLTLASYRANLMGANASLKELAEKKKDAAIVQEALNKTSEEYGIDADALSRGKIKQAKKGATINKAEDGDKYQGLDKYYTDEQWQDIYGAEKPEYEFMKAAVSNSKNKTSPKEQGEKQEYPWIPIANEAARWFRPRYRIEQPDLTAEMMAAGMNQLEPVQAQRYQPLLPGEPPSISMQDQLNEITAQTRQAQRNPAVAGNPAAQAIIAAQAYGPKSSVLANQFRTNQELREKYRMQNLETLNDAQLKNLGISDQQFVRQAQAKSNTKQAALEIAKSMSDKIARAKQEQTLADLERWRYNYVFGPNGVPINWNGIAQFNMQGSEQYPGLSTLPENKEPIYRRGKDGEWELYDIATKSWRKESKGRSSANGSIVRALKNL